MNAPLGGTPQSLTGLHVVDAEGAKVGLVQQVYRDDATNEPEWITVRTGLFGMKESFVPLAGARRTGDELHVPHTKATIKEAPKIDADGHLDPSEEERLYRHYGLIRPVPTGPTEPTEPPGTTGTSGVTGTSGTTGVSGTMGTAGTSEASGTTGTTGTTGRTAGGGAAGGRGRAAAEPTVRHRTRAGAERNKLTDARTRDETRPREMSRGGAEPETARGTEDTRETARPEEHVAGDTGRRGGGAEAREKGRESDDDRGSGRDERGGSGTGRQR
ncbi:PRC-barrel domain-containing protein [Streptomyces sp. RGM 3693]|uniref:PRC-barrel domain-containing protein n=1 Tax=Streptomyces sp. RGM 3693 TaxID=3413284 RepID=UPI003D2E16E5